MVRVDVNDLSPVFPVQDTEFVEVLFARTRDEAEICRRSLESRSIPARVENNPELPGSCGIAVLVPGGRLVDASEVLTMAHDEDEDEFEIEADDDDAEFEDEDDLDLDDDADSEFEDDDEELDEEDDDL